VVSPELLFSEIPIRAGDLLRQTRGMARMRNPITQMDLKAHFFEKNFIEKKLPATRQIWLKADC
jgi:hypothetical protein